MNLSLCAVPVPVQLSSLSSCTSAAHQRIAARISRSGTVGCLCRLPVTTASMPGTHAGGSGDQLTLVWKALVWVLLLHHHLMSFRMSSFHASCLVQLERLESWTGTGTAQTDRFTRRYLFSNLS